MIFKISRFAINSTTAIFNEPLICEAACPRMGISLGTIILYVSDLLSAAPTLNRG